MMKLINNLLIAVTFLFTPVAFAGQTQPAEVDVDTVNRTASGDMLTARFSSDNDVFIGCGVRSIDTGGGSIINFGFCQAEDSDGDRDFCNTDSTELLDVMKATSDFSFVTYSWDVNGVCTRIGFSTQSFYLPKKLK